MKECKLCDWVHKATKGLLPELLWETPHSIAIVGEHQFFEGYGMVISKAHVREMHGLPLEIAIPVFQDVMTLGGRIEKAYHPWKINYASLGNKEEHLHWHVFPRYLSEQNHLDHPWKNAEKFDQFNRTEVHIENMRHRLLNTVSLCV